MMLRLGTLFKTPEHSQNFTILMSDGSAVCIAVGKTLKTEFSNVIHVTRCAQI